MRALHYRDYQLPDHLYSLRANANLHGVALSHYKGDCCVMKEKVMA